MARPPLDGEVFYLDRVRWQSWRHSEELHKFLKQFCSVGRYEKMGMLEQLLKGAGFDSDSLLPVGEGVEDQLTKELLDSFLK